MKRSVKLRGVKLGGEAHFTGTETVKARRAPASCLAKYTRARLDEPNVVRTWRGPKVQKALFTVFTLEHSVSETRAKHRAGTTPDHFGHAAGAKSGVVPAQLGFCPRPNSSSRIAQPQCSSTLWFTRRVNEM